MCMPIIAYSGAHGTGKTTATYRAAYELKMNNPSMEVGYIAETARMCPFPLMGENSTTSKNGQIWVFAEQIRREQEAIRHYDLVVSDRTVCDSLAYAVLAFGEEDPVVRGMFEYVRGYLSEFKYQEVRFLTTTRNPFCVQDGFRATSGREEIEKILLDLYDRLSIPLVML